LIQWLTRRWLFRMGRKVPSIINSVWRAINRILSYRPPRHIMAIALVVIAIFLFSGGIYNIAIQPNIAWGLQLFYPRRLHEQLVGESLVVMIFYALGTLGLILIYRSSRYRRNPSRAHLLIWIGIALIIMVFIIFEIIFYRWKLGLGL